MISPEVRSQVSELIKQGKSAPEIGSVLKDLLPAEILNRCWQIPRENIYNFVFDRLNSQVFSDPILDLGCGRRSYYPEVASILGSQLTYVALDHYHPPVENNPLHLPNVLGEVQTIPLADNSVATVLATELLEHTPDDDQVVGEIARVMRGGGFLIITLPGQDIPKHDKPPYQIDYRRYTIPQVSFLLSGHGFNRIMIGDRYFEDWQINIFATASLAK